MTDDQIKLSRSLYAEEGVRQAAEAWREVTTFSVAVDGEEIVVRIGEFDGDREALCDEFCNHALYETIVLDLERSRSEDP